MARLDGQKKSPLPLVLGLAAIAALGAGGYYVYAQNQGVDTVAVSPSGVETVDNKPGGVGEDGNVNVETRTDAENGEGASASAATESGTTAPDAMGTSAPDSANADSNSTDSANSTEANTQNSGSGNAESGAMMGATAAPDAKSGAMGDSNTMGGSNATSTSTSTTTEKEAAKPIAAREKTIEKDGAKVTYRKEVLSDGSEKRTTKTEESSTGSSGASN